MTAKYTHGGEAYRCLIQEREDMEILKVLLITLLAAVGGGCLIGVLSGKHAVKKAFNKSKPLLSIKERIIYAGLLAGGAACILAGIFLVSPGGEGDLIDPGLDGKPGMEGEEFGMEGEYTMGGDEFTMGDVDGGDGLEDSSLDDGDVEEALPEGDEDSEADGEATDADEESSGEESADETAGSQASGSGGTASRSARIGGGGVAVYRIG